MNKFNNFFERLSTKKVNEIIYNNMDTLYHRKCCVIGKCYWKFLKAYLISFRIKFFAEHDKRMVYIKILE